MHHFAGNRLMMGNSQQLLSTIIAVVRSLYFNSELRDILALSNRKRAMVTVKKSRRSSVDFCNFSW